MVWRPSALPLVSQAQGSRAGGRSDLTGGLWAPGDPGGTAWTPLSCPCPLLAAPGWGRPLPGCDLASMRGGISARGRARGPGAWLPRLAPSGWRCRDHAGRRVRTPRAPRSAQSPRQGPGGVAARRRCESRRDALAPELPPGPKGVCLGGVRLTGACRSQEARTLAWAALREDSRLGREAGRRLCAPRARPSAFAASGRRDAWPLSRAARGIPVRAT